MSLLLRVPLKQLWGKLTLERLWPVAAIAAVFYFTSTRPIQMQDFWWHLKAGQEILSSHSILTVDTFSHTMGGTIYNNYATFWLMEVAYSVVYALGGPELIVFFHTLLVTSAYALLLWLCWRIACNWRIAAFATLFASIVGAYNWGVCPQGIAFPAGILVLSAIYRYRAHPRRWLLAIPPIATLVWVNGHGSYVISLVLLGIWLADEIVSTVRSRYRCHEERRRSHLWAASLALLATGFACLVNPRGFGAFSYVLNLSSNPVIQSLVPEWAPPAFTVWYGTIFLIALLLCAVMLAVSPRRPSLFQILTYLGFGTLALSTTRGVVWFGIAMAPVVAEHLKAIFAAEAPAQFIRPERKQNLTLNWLILLILLWGTVLSLPWLKHMLPLPLSNRGVISRDTPLAATRVLLKEKPAGPLFNDLGFGSYLIWAAQPDYPVFVDARLELYPIELWNDYLDISSARSGWQEGLDRFGIKTLILSLRSQPLLIKAVRNSIHWRRLYGDEVAAIFVRTE